MSVFRQLLMQKASGGDKYFTLTIQTTSDNQAWQFNYYCNTGGSLNIIDWGDGESGTYSGNSVASHTYTNAGTYKIQMQGNLYRVTFGSPSVNANTEAVIDCNGKWEMLGNITNFTYGFSYCTNFVGKSLKSLPANLENGLRAFYNTPVMESRITYLPETLTSGNQTFYRSNAYISLDRLPPNLANGSRMFSDAPNTVINLDTLAANAPADGWTALTTISYMFTRCTRVTGSKSAFLAKCPNVTTSDYWATGTSTTE